MLASKWKSKTSSNMVDLPPKMSNDTGNSAAYQSAQLVPTPKTALSMKLSKKLP